MSTTNKILLVETPAPHVLLLTMNRPSVLNAMSPELEEALARALDAFDADNSLWVCIVAGTGRVFCAGADLAAWQKRQSTSSKEAGTETTTLLASPHGFGTLSRRTVSSKPIIAAVQGGAYGGGCEIVLNVDMVVAEEDSKFALPEVRRGVVAAAGGIPRILEGAGYQVRARVGKDGGKLTMTLAAEMLFTGRTVSAKEAYERFRFVNVLAPKGQALKAALALAGRVCEASPDAVRSSKRALVIARGEPGAERAYELHAKSREAEAVWHGQNIKEGLAAFVEKRKPKWTNPAKL